MASLDRKQLIFSAPNHLDFPVLLQGPDHFFSTCNFLRMRNYTCGTLNFELVDARTTLWRFSKGGPDFAGKFVPGGTYFWEGHIDMGTRL